MEESIFSYGQDGAESKEERSIWKAQTSEGETVGAQLEAHTTRDLLVM